MNATPERRQREARRGLACATPSFLISLVVALAAGRVAHAADNEPHDGDAVQVAGTAAAERAAPAKAVATESAAPAKAVATESDPRLEHDPASSRDTPMMVWAIVGAVGVGATVAGVVSLINGLTTTCTEDRSGRCDASYSRADVEELNDRRHRSFALAGVFGGGGVLLTALSAHAIQTLQPKTSGSVRGGPWIARNGGGAVVKGSF